MIQFDLREIPHAKTEQIVGYYPVVSNQRMLSAGQLCETISHRCTVNAADVKAVMSALAQVMTETLRDGGRVEVPEIGSFFPQIASEETITAPADKQIARHLYVRGIGFRPKQALTDTLQDTSFRRADDAGQTAEALTEEEVKARITAYLSDGSHEVLERAPLQALAGCRATKAKAWLKKLTEEGFLKKKGKKNAPYYTLA